MITTSVRSTPEAAHSCARARRTRSSLFHSARLAQEKPDRRHKLGEIYDAIDERGATREAEALARQIVRDFTAARLNARAVTALGYLSEAIAARKASAVTVENVRRFIHTLRRDPDAEFRATA